MTTPISGNGPAKRAPEAFVSAELFGSGMGYVIVSRFKSQGRVEAGVFLVDAYCLGIKNAFFTVLHESEYQERFLDEVFANGGTQAIEPSCARKLVEDAVKYAEGLGFAPHPDYRAACRVFGGIVPDACGKTFTFGREGKPFFFQGPNDSPEKCERILRVLRARCGEGNYDFLLVTPGFDEP